MNQAVDGMNDERAFIFTCFGAPHTSRTHTHAGSHRPHPQREKPEPRRPRPRLRRGADHDAARAHVGRVDIDDPRGRFRCALPLPPDPAPSPPRARPLLPYPVLPVPLSPDPRGLPRLQATCGVSWSIYVIVRQVHPPPSTRPRPKPRLPGPERCRAARVAGSPHPPEVWAQQGRHRHLRGHARCGGRQAVPPLVRGASSPEGGGSPPPPPALRRHWAPVAFEHAGPPAARKRSSTTTSRTRAQGSSRASRRRLARGQKARTTYEPRRLGATPCARTCCLRGTDMRPRVSFADTLCYCGGA
jgi:hypothetical protein